MKQAARNPRSVGSKACQSLFNFEGLAMQDFQKMVDGKSHQYGGIAQLGERLLCKQEVNGSIPFISTMGFWWEPESREMGL
jgi:hypothetical protein